MKTGDAVEAAVDASLQQKVDKIKDDIAAGRIEFWNSPPEWTEELLSATAWTCVLLLLSQEARWN